MYFQLFKQEQTQKHLEAIVDNLEESLITVNNGSIEFINNKFKSLFQGLGFSMSSTQDKSL